MKIFRNLLVSVILAVSAITFSHVVAPTAYAQDQETSYVGSSKSTKYHRPSCSAAQKINASNRVEFGSKEDAEKAGRVPCKICKP